MIAAALAAVLTLPAGVEGAVATPFRAALVSPASATAERLRAARRRGDTHVALDLRDPLDGDAVARAAAAGRSAGLAVAAWIEVARDPALADARPEWMASLGVHEDWRGRFPSAPPTRDGAVVKAWPWVPISSTEAFARHLERVAEKLRAVPGGVDAVLLSGVQGGPSSCGCGNDLCRWAADYHVPSTATLDWTAETMSRFVERVEAIAPHGCPVIAVVVTECEENDLPDRAGACCIGVGCYRGLCWPNWTGQIAALARNKERRVGVLVLPREFARVEDAYAAAGGWAAEVARLFREMPGRYGAAGIAADRLVAVIAAGDRDGLTAAEKAGFGGVVTAEVDLPQSFEPRSVPIPKPR